MENTKFYSEIFTRLDKLEKEVKRLNSKISNLVNEDNEIKNNSEKFYKMELENVPDGEEDTKFSYKIFIHILFGENDLNKKLTGVLSIPEQVTYVQFKKIYYKSKRVNKKLSEILTSMENNKKYYKGKKSLFLTINNTWLKENKF